MTVKNCLCPRLVLLELGHPHRLDVGWLGPGLLGVVNASIVMMVALWASFALPSFV